MFPCFHFVFLLFVKSKVDWASPPHAEVEREDEGGRIGDGSRAP